MSNSSSPKQVPLTEAVRDFLEELTNVGAGQSAGILHRLTGKKVELTVPEVIVLPPEGGVLAGQIKQKGQEAIAVIHDFHGYQVQGKLLFLVSIPEARKIIRVLLGQVEDTDGYLNPPELKSLQQIAMVMTNSFIQAISIELRLNLVTGLSEVRQGKLESLRDFQIDEPQNRNPVIAIVVNFSTTTIAGEIEMTCYFCLVMKESDWKAFRASVDKYAGQRTQQKGREQ